MFVTIDARWYVTQHGYILTFTAGDDYGAVINRVTNLAYCARYCDES